MQNSISFPPAALPPRKKVLKKNTQQIMLLVIHAAAQRFPDKMEKEPEKSWDLNVTSTKTISEATLYTTKFSFQELHAQCARKNEKLSF